MLRSIKINWSDLARPDGLETPYASPERTASAPAEINAETLATLLEDIGLVGMGGAGFPVAEKIRSGVGARALVINGVECEPGITIDTAILLNHARWVTAGARASAKAIGASETLLAVKNDSSVTNELRRLYPDFKLVVFPPVYPAGAEKLILKKLTGKTPPAGARPRAFGYVTQNVATLRAMGRALLDGVAATERPLTLTKPSTGFYKNLVAPVGLRVGELLERFHLTHDPSRHVIVDSGLMMGREIGVEDVINQTTLSILVLRRDMAWRAERPCVRCGACDAACPLGLHPFQLAERVRKGKTRSAAFKAQMAECFSCGVCAAVCPSDVPLMKLLERGKRCP